MPPKTPHANASPLGRTFVAIEKSPPGRKGPAARPAAESVCARPFNAPRTELFGAEFVIYHVQSQYRSRIEKKSDMRTYKQQRTRQPSHRRNSLHEQHKPQLNP